MMLFRRFAPPLSNRRQRDVRLRFELLEQRQLLYGEHLAPLVDPVPIEASWLAPDFAMPDVNATSPTTDQTVSPRNYIGTVTGWYFGYAT